MRDMRIQVVYQINVFRTQECFDNQERGCCWLTAFHLHYSSNVFSIETLTQKIIDNFQDIVMYTRAYTPNVTPRSAQILGTEVSQQFDTIAATTAPIKEKTFRKVLLQVSSSQRDLGLKPSPSDFEVRLPKPITNVYSARVLQCTLPYASPVTTTPLVYVRVNDFNNISNTDGTEHYTSMSFPQQTGATAFGHLNTTALSAVCMDQTSSRQLTRLERVKVQLFGSTGESLALPSEVSITEANQVHVLIELTVLE